jgi:peroxiredoxin Q/BCP
MLKEGDKIPEIVVKNQFDKSVNLHDFIGKKLVIFFYPRANTPGCTAEACNLSDNYSRFQKSGYEILGVSADTVKKQLSFSNKYEFPYMLLADVDKEIIKSFGVWGPKKFQGREYEGIIRTTFIIDKNGFVKKIITKVKTKDHTSQILG